MVWRTQLALLSTSATLDDLSSTGRTAAVARPRMASRVKGILKVGFILKAVMAGAVKFAQRGWKQKVSWVGYLLLFDTEKNNL